MQIAVSVSFDLYVQTYAKNWCAGIRWPLSADCVKGSKRRAEQARDGGWELASPSEVVTFRCSGVILYWYKQWVEERHNERDGNSHH